MKQFKSQMTDQVAMILKKEYAVNVSLININQVKNFYRKDNHYVLNGLYPVIFEQINLKLTEDMKQSQKLAVIKEDLEVLKDLIKPFVVCSEDEGNTIFQIALFCSKNPLIKECFDLILQLLYQNFKVLGERSIVDWVASARTQVE